MKSNFYSVFFICLFLFFSGYSQTNENDYSFTTITTENGLSNNIIYDILQDKEGYMWFATNNGLNRYDGYTVKTFFHSDADTASIASNVVRCLIEDQEGGFWVGTKDGLNKYNKDFQRFEKHLIIKDSGFTSNQVMSMQFDDLGKIWLTVGNHIGNFNPKSQTIESVMGFDTFMVNTTVKNKSIWISDADEQVYEYNIDTKELKKRASNIKMNGIHYGESSKSLWIPASFNPKKQSLSFRRLPELPNNSYPKYLIELDTRVSWIGTNNGLYEYNYDSKTLTKILVGKSTLTNQVRSLYKDKAGGVWVGTLGGVFNYDPYRKVFKHNDLIENYDDIIMALHKDKSRIYANALGKGLYFKSKNSNQFDPLILTETFPKKGLLVWDIETVSENKFPLWMATNNGLLCLNPETLAFRKIEIPLADKDENISFSILNTKQDFIWATTHRAIHKIQKNDGKILDSFSMDEQIEYPGIQNISAFGNYLFIATESNGLFKFDTNSKQFSSVYLNDNEGILDTPIWDLFVSKNTLWIGTNDGLYRLNLKKLIVKPVQEDNQVIFSITQDDSGILWMGTDKGLKSYNIDNQKTKYYNTVDGLKNTEFNRKSIIKDISGRIWLGGFNGITSFNPELIKKDNPNTPNIHITAFRVATSDSTFSIPLFKNNITLPWEYNTIELDYVGLNYTNSIQNKYRYLMDGHDPNWVKTDKPNTARYVKLPVGNYNFKVKAANSDGVWNTEGANLEITIKPPFWRTNTAYIFYVFLY